MGNTGTMDKTVTIQTSSDCDDNYEVILNYLRNARTRYAAVLFF